MAELGEPVKITLQRAEAFCDMVGGSDARAIIGDEDAE